MSSLQELQNRNLDENRGPEFRAFLICMLTLSITVVALRFWSRAIGPRVSQGKATHRFWWDDWVAFLALICLMAFTAVAITLVHFGLGRHIWTLDETELLMVFKLFYTVYYVYDVSLFLTKTSALLFLTRLFPRHTNPTWWNIALWVTHGMNSAWFVGICFGTAFMCKPLAKGWNPLIPGECGATSALWIGSAIPSVIIDLVILLLPLPKIWFLHISVARKTGVTLVFILGYCVIIVSLGRLITVLRSAKALDQDITYEGMPMVYWVSTECPATIISICLPPMLNIVRHFYKGFLSPFTSKISSMMTSKSTASSSTIKSPGMFSRSGLKYSGGNSDVNLRTESNGSSHSLWQLDNRGASVEITI
ncbi:hypothetical protein BU24DRAFT_400218 [Aaosphaeria arxii CBS 175.79]|uniref:Rhodopsin domain-containing protein n=1 Tax=Aaosphaeria arxii CBS 175.79 TaxID=1450172 RepID=A0A6A5XCQ1_9PLEO|nr:uncharacterized protein BU24DRAFT_400218 [Aaosphaeria arxii CBS 175.79]KAF2010700.1 hypothetical protein BU24DRAFT_400218 [Aaosphaeria arxii CBS 175.79]